MNHRLLTRFALLLVLLAAFGCKKEAEPQPSKTDYLTGTTWKDSQTLLQLNTYSGTKATTAPNTYQFAADGKFTQTSSGNAATTGTWKFASNETQLVVTAGATTTTFELLELTKDRLHFGVRFGQAEIQQAYNGGSGTNANLIKLLVLSAGEFTFPAGVPTLTTSQITSLQYSNLAVPR